MFKERFLQPETNRPKERLLRNFSPIKSNPTNLRPCNYVVNAFSPLGLILLFFFLQIMGTNCFI